MSEHTPKNSSRSSIKTSQDLEYQQKILEQRARYYAQNEDQQDSQEFEVIVFTRGPQRYALTLPSLCAVRPLPRFCSIPGASAVIPGVFPYQGEVLSLHDLAAFAFGKSPDESPEWVLVIEYEDQKMGLLGDQILGVESVREASLQSSPLTIHRLGDIVQALLPNDTILLSRDKCFAHSAFAKIQ